MVRRWLGIMLVWLALAGHAAAAAAPGDKPVPLQDQAGTGWNRHETTLTADKVGQLERGWSRATGYNGPVLVAGETVLAACQPAERLVGTCALGASSGRQRWFQEFSAHGVVGDTVYGLLPGPYPHHPRLAAVRLADGAVLWETRMPDSVQGIRVSTLGLVYVTTPRAMLHAYDAATGAERWKVFGSYAAPVVAGGLLYGTLPSGPEVPVFDARTGQRKWAYRHGHMGVPGPVAVANGLVYVANWAASDEWSTLLAFDADGCGAALCEEPEWTSNLGGRGPTGIAVTDKVGYAIAWGGLSDWSAPGELFAFDALTGETLWSAPDAKGWASPTVAADVVYLSTFTGELVAYAAGGCGKPTCAALRRWTVSKEHQNRVEPTVAHGVLYHNAANAVRTFHLPARWPPPAGYWMLGAPGTVFGFGDVSAYPSAAVGSGAVAVDMDGTSTGDGYWVLDDAGHVFAYGDARYLGAPSVPAGDRAVSIAGTTDDDGYWVFTAAGRVYPFGDAGHHGDMAGVPLNGPMLDSIATPSGRGYYMVASDGGVFAFGDAAFLGSMGGQALNAPVRSLAPDPDGVGYWLVAGDGGVFAFDAGFRGSMGGHPLNRPVVGMAGFGNGYLLVGADGGIFNFSDKPFAGSLGANPPPYPITSVAAL